MFVVPWILILLAVPLHGYDVMMVIGGRYYDHARQAYIELSTVEVNPFFFKQNFVSCEGYKQPNETKFSCHVCLEILAEAE